MLEKLARTEREPVMYDDNCEHEELLELAGRAELAARSHDHATLLATTRCFLTMLAMHLDNERKEQRVLDDAVREYRARDEQKLVEEFVNLVEVATRSDGQCRCERCGAAKHYGGCTIRSRSRPRMTDSDENRMATSPCRRCVSRLEPGEGP